MRKKEGSYEKHRFDLGRTAAGGESGAAGLCPNRAARSGAPERPGARGPDALRSLKTVLVKAEAKHWEPGQSYSISGESRFLGDSTLTISVDYANPIRVRFDWDRAMQYPAVDHVKYSEIRYPTYGAVIDDKGAVTPMSGIRLAANLREGRHGTPARLLLGALDAPESVSAIEDQKLDNRTLPAGAWLIV